jgi:hypothetical protein
MKEVRVYRIWLCNDEWCMSHYLDWREEPSKQKRQGNISATKYGFCVFFRGDVVSVSNTIKIG